jgi:hypothetical protein
MTTSNQPCIQLHADEAADLLELLGRLTDWLGHAGEGTHEEITEFFNGPGNGRLAVAGLVAVLDQHTATLHRRCKETTP